MTITTFNIYCDESRVENENSCKMVIGAILIPREQAKKISKEIKEIKTINNFFQEIKWNKTGEKFDSFYRQLINYFVKNKNIQFRCIIVDKSAVEYDVYHDNDKELAFYKFYYLMLRAKLADNNHYYIFLDRKPTRDKNRARSLKAYLDSYVLLHKSECNIQHLQSYSSSENVLIQLSDFFTGLIGYVSNEKKKSYKQFLVSYLCKKLKKNKLPVSTSLSEMKFNVFNWNHKNEKNR